MVAIKKGVLVLSISIKKYLHFLSFIFLVCLLCVACGRRETTAIGSRVGSFDFKQNLPSEVLSQTLRGKTLSYQQKVSVGEPSAGAEILVRWEVFRDEKLSSLLSASFEVSKSAPGLKILNVKIDDTHGKAASSDKSKQTLLARINWYSQMLFRENSGFRSIQISTDGTFRDLGNFDLFNIGNGLS